MPLLTSVPAESSKTTCQSEAFREVKSSRVMIVDDEPINIAVLQSYLEMDGYSQISSSENAAVAIEQIRVDRPDVVLLDIHMPGVSGLDILAELREDSDLAATPVIILTASTDDETKVRALKAGATDFLAKPVHQGELLARLRNILAMKIAQDRLVRYSENLEQMVRQRTAELEASRQDVIHCLARAAEFRDDDTGKHVLRVGRYVRLIAEQLGYPKDDLDTLELAAQLHDVGKIGIPDAILLKPEKLTPAEFEVMQQHCSFGRSIVDQPSLTEQESVHMHTDLGWRIMDVARSPLLELAKRIALSHHERWDGRGYPHGLAGASIPLEGRITAVADVFDALSSKRVYKPAFGPETCFAILEEGRGVQFDPQVLDAFFARKSEILQVQVEHADNA